MQLDNKVVSVKLFQQFMSDQGQINLTGVNFTNVSQNDPENGFLIYLINTLYWSIITEPRSPAVFNFLFSCVYSVEQQPWD